jgi:hypothetical protein
MKHATFALLLLVSIAGFGAQAQSGLAELCHEGTSQQICNSILVPNQDNEQIAARRQAQYKERQFWQKANKVADLWTAFVREYNQKGTFNVKKAREVSKAFHDLEKTEGWPK